MEIVRRWTCCLRTRLKKSDAEILHAFPRWMFLLLGVPDQAQRKSTGGTSDGSTKSRLLTECHTASRQPSVAMYVCRSSPTPSQPLGLCSKSLLSLCSTFILYFMIPSLSSLCVVGFFGIASMYTSTRTGTCQQVEKILHTCRSTVVLPLPTIPHPSRHSIAS